MNRTVWCDRGWMPYHYGFCPNEIAWKHSMKMMKIPNAPAYPAEYDGRCVHFENVANSNACSIVTMRPLNKSSLEQISMLYHEAVHVWQAMREAIGEDKPSHEFEAYSIQNIGKQLIIAYEQSRGELTSKRKSRSGY